MTDMISLKSSSLPLKLKGTVQCGAGTLSSSCNRCPRNNSVDSSLWCDSIHCFFDIERNTCEVSSKFIIFPGMLYKLS